MEVVISCQILSGTARDWEPKGMNDGVIVRRAEWLAGPCGNYVSITHTYR